MVGHLDCTEKSRHPVAGPQPCLSPTVWLWTVLLVPLLCGSPIKRPTAHRHPTSQTNTASILVFSSSFFYAHIYTYYIHDIRSLTQFSIFKFTVV